MNAPVLREGDRVVFKSDNAPVMSGIVLADKPHSPSSLETRWNIRWRIRKDKLRKPSEKETVWIPLRCILEVNGTRIERNK